VTFEVTSPKLFDGIFTVDTVPLTYNGLNAPLAVTVYL